MRSLPPLVLLVVLCACGDGGKSAAPAPAPAAKVDPKVIIREPEWTRRPTAAEVAALRPPQAAEFKLSAVAGLWCTAQADGSLADCQIDWQDPPGMGFGDAAMKAAPLFRMAPTDSYGLVEGRPVQAQVTWPKP
jgi:protein TonB